MNVYPFIEAEKAGQDGNVAMACVLLKVSRSAYYEWSKHVPSARESPTPSWATRSSTSTQEPRTYGAPRIPTELAKRASARAKARGPSHGPSRPGRALQAPLQGDDDRLTPRPDARPTSSSGPSARGLELDTAWCGDITYVRTWEGWLYLATVIDLASRKVVGCAMADHMRADLVCDALQMALEQRTGTGVAVPFRPGNAVHLGPVPPPLAEHGIIQSLSRRANAGTTQWPKAGSPP